MAADRETLADWLAEQEGSHNRLAYTDEATTWITASVEDLADALLASDWLAARDAAMHAAGAAKALTPIRRYCEAQAVTARARGHEDRDWLDALILIVRVTP